MSDDVSPNSLPHDNDPNMLSVNDAMVHLHNLAYMFKSPLVLVEALRVVESRVAFYADLTAKVDTLQRHHDTLTQETTALEERYASLTKTVKALQEKHDLLQGSIRDAVKGLIAQVKE